MDARLLDLERQLDLGGRCMGDAAKASRGVGGRLLGKTWQRQSLDWRTLAISWRTMVLPENWTVALDGD